MSVLTRLRRTPPPSVAEEEVGPDLEAGTTPIAEVRFRERARVAGRVRSVRIQPWAGVATLECTLVDETGGLLLLFLGRRQVAGIHCGTRLVVEGMVGERNGNFAILNPHYDFLLAAETPA